MKENPKLRKSKINVLFTGAGGSGTIYILKNLKKYDIYRTIAVDMNPYAAGLYIADRGYKVPPCNDPKYMKIILQIIKKENIDVVVPLIDEELMKMFEVENIGVKVLLPKKDFVKMALDKYETYIKLKDTEIPVPKTYLLKDIDFSDISFPLVVKPRFGRGSRGFKLFKDIEEFYSYLYEVRMKYGEKLLVQEAILGKEFTVSVVVTKNGKIISIVPKEVIIKKGITKVGVTRYNNNIMKICKKIQDIFKANGPFNVQIIVDEKNKIPYVIEINPRFSTTVALTIESGIDEVDILIRDILGLSLPKLNKKFKENLLMLRYEEQIFINENDIQKIGVQK